MAENVVAIKRAWTPLADSSWKNIESIFEVQQQQHEQQQKTPPRKVVEPSLPGAPRKLQLQQHRQQAAQIRREGLKPRRLIYDLSSPDSGIDADKENQPPPLAAAASPQSSIQESGKSRAKRRQVKAIKDQKTKPPSSELRLRLRI